MLAIDADVRDTQIMILGGVTRIDRVELGGRIVGRAGSLVALVGLEGCGRGDERDAAFGDYRERTEPAKD